MKVQPSKPLAAYAFPALCLVCTCAAAQNVVFILSDDQGWTGSSVQMDSRVPDSSSDLYRTPNLERLAAQGMTFSNAYSPAPNCSPTRMSIQTGKTAARLGATDIIDVVPDENGRAGIQIFYDNMYLNKPMIVPLPVSDLPDEEVTIAEFLKQHDSRYATGHFGKWHMGGGSPGNHGYDAHNGLTTNTPGQAGPPNPKLTREVTEEGLAFIEEQVEAQRPFFVQFSYYAVHTPVLAMPETIDRFRQYDSQRHTNTAYAAMTAELDEAVGHILDKLNELGLAETTYVIFSSDNGGEVFDGVTNNLPLAKGKTHVWEGGIRVPLFIRGPGIEARSESHVPVIGYDLFPTIAEWVGASASLPGNLDGGSLHAVLRNGGTGAVERGTEALIWYYGAYRNQKHVAPQTALRRGNYKLIWELDSQRTYLFDLDGDLSETTDLTRFRPQIAESLFDELRTYLMGVGTEFPTVNPDYDPARDGGLLSLAGAE